MATNEPCSDIDRDRTETLNTMDLANQRRQQWFFTEGKPNHFGWYFPDFDEINPSLHTMGPVPEQSITRQRRNETIGARLFPG